VTITGPDGDRGGAGDARGRPGAVMSGLAGPRLGLYRLAQGDLTRGHRGRPRRPRANSSRPSPRAKCWSPWRRRRAGCWRWRTGCPTCAPCAEGPRRRRARLDRDHPARGLCHDRCERAPLLPAWAWLLIAAGAGRRRLADRRPKGPPYRLQPLWLSRRIMRREVEANSRRIRTPVATPSRRSSPRAPEASQGRPARNRSTAGRG
jgi:hypothetical protein